MTKKILLILIFIFLSITFIFSAKPEFNIIDKEGFKNVKNWIVDLEYKHITIETKELSDKKIEKTIKDFGYYDDELFFLNYLYNTLKYKNNINIDLFDSKNKESGYIKFILVKYPGLSICCSFNIYDKNNKLLAFGRNWSNDIDQCVVDVSNQLLKEIK